MLGWVQSITGAADPGGQGLLQGFEEVEHTANWASRARGRDLEELFANAAHALFSLERTSPAEAGDVTREVQVEGADR
jgi:SHS2 domain-containing protein